MASLVLGAIGSALGFGQFGIWILSAIGAIIDAILFAPDPQSIEGPKIDDLNTTKADPGDSIPIVFGWDRVPGSPIHSTNLIETKKTEKQGGKGGGSVKTTTYTYHVDIDFMLCIGPILGVARIWVDGKILRGPVVPPQDQLITDILEPILDLNWMSTGNQAEMTTEYLGYPNDEDYIEDTFYSYNFAGFFDYTTMERVHSRYNYRQYADIPGPNLDPDFTEIMNEEYYNGYTYSHLPVADTKQFFRTGYVTAPEDGLIHSKATHLGINNLHLPSIPNTMYSALNTLDGFGGYDRITRFIRTGGKWIANPDHTTSTVPGNLDPNGTYNIAFDDSGQLVMYADNPDPLQLNVDFIQIRSVTPPLFAVQNTAYGSGFGFPHTGTPGFLQSPPYYTRIPGNKLLFVAYSTNYSTLYSRGNSAMAYHVNLTDGTVTYIDNLWDVGQGGVQDAANVQLPDDVGFVNGNQAYWQAVTYDPWNDKIILIWRVPGELSDFSVATKRYGELVWATLDGDLTNYQYHGYISHFGARDSSDVRVTTNLNDAAYVHESVITAWDYNRHTHTETFGPGVDMMKTAFISKIKTVTAGAIQTANPGLGRAIKILDMAASMVVVESVSDRDNLLPVGSTGNPGIYDLVFTGASAFSSDHEQHVFYNHATKTLSGTAASDDYPNYVLTGNASGVAGPPVLAFYFNSVVPVFYLSLGVVATPTKCERWPLPLPPWFYDFQYDPELIPWSIDPADTATASTERYVMTLSPTGVPTFTETLTPTADIDNGIIVYWQDTATGYYIPMPGSHQAQPGVKSIAQDYLDRSAETGDPDPSVSVIVGLRRYIDYYNTYDLINDFSPTAVLQHKNVDNFTLYHGTDDQLQNAVMEALAGETIPAYRERAHIVMERWELGDYGNRIGRITFEIVQEDRTSPGKIISKLLDLTDVPNLNWDVTALEGEAEEDFCDVLAGFTVNRDTNYRATLENLIDFVNVDVAELGSTLTFRPIDRDPDHIIDYNELGARSLDNGYSTNVPTIMKATRRRPSAMPQKLFVNFRDAFRDYQQNTGSFVRQVVTGASNKSIIESSAALFGDTVTRYARDKMRRLWLERVHYEDTGPPGFVFISPSDIVTIINGPRPWTVKVTKATRGQNGLIELDFIEREGVRYVASESESDTIAYEDQFSSNPGGLPDPGTKIALMDLPTLIDDGDQFGHYFSMTGLSDVGWDGATYYRRTTGVGTYEPLQSYATDGIMGATETATLVNIGAQFDAMDYTSVIIVKLTKDSDSLTGADLLDLSNGKNYCLIGNEICQFAKVTGLGDKRFQLEWFTRGRFGTDDQISTHVADERFVLLSDPEVTVRYDPISHLGRTYDVKAVTVGNTLVNTPTFQNFTNTGRKLRPYSVVNIGATYNQPTNNNATIVWTRRNRINARPFQPAGVPMSEGIERYRVQIWNDGRTILLRETEVDDTTQLLYTEAQQTTDFGAAKTDGIEVTIQQWSVSVGWGITRNARV